MTKVMGFTLAGLLVVAPMVALAAPGNSGNGGNNGNHSGMGGGGSNGQGGGDGGRGGHGGHGGGHHGGGHGGGGKGGGNSPSMGVSQSGGVSASGGTLTITGGQGISKGDRDKLIDAIKACEMTRPGLALGNHDVNGGWSFVTFDDTVGPYVQRCMAERGYPAQGADYSAPSNFGTR